MNEPPITTEGMHSIVNPVNCGEITSKLPAEPTT